MKNLFLILFFLILFSNFGFTQTENNSAAVKWGKYKISKDKIEIVFPKLPVRLEWGDICSQTLTNSYYAFADEVVYEFKIFKKSENEIPGYCSEPKKFSEQNFTNYFANLEAGLNNGKFQRVERGENKFLKFEKQNNDFKYTLWLLNDYKNNRWFEFKVSSRNDKITNELQFIDSLKFAIDSKSIEIFDGSDKVLGDENLLSENPTEEKESVKNNQTKDKISPLTIIIKPSPKYTDVARKSNTVGSVKMRITFLSNGAIGDISVVEGVANGLTEQAIIAAKKMAFLPVKNGDRTEDTTKTVIYTFSIY
ncbi:hypothetical protein BH20ACI4_BH20ACI4_16750 [soil metagenome]